jgi:hypothetical protein
VDADGNAEVYIDNLDQKSNWEICHTGETMEENGISYTFYTYENQAVKPFVE